MGVKYREVYKVIEARRKTNGGLLVSDFSGWKVARQTYIDRCRPLWIIIEDTKANRRYWVTHDKPDMEITYRAMDERGRNCGVTHRIRCQSKKQLAEKLQELFDESAA